MLPGIPEEPFPKWVVSELKVKHEVKNSSVSLSLPNIDKDILSDKSKSIFCLKHIQYFGVVM